MWPRGRKGSGGRRKVGISTTGWDPGEPVGIKTPGDWDGRGRDICVYAWNVDFSLFYGAEYQRGKLLVLEKIRLGERPSCKSWREDFNAT